MDDFGSGILDSKPITNKAIYDLVEQTYAFNYDLVQKTGTKILKNETGRIDKLCLRIFGTHEYIHELTKMNEIYNPFSILECDDIVHAMPQQASFMGGAIVEKENARVLLIEEYKKSFVDPKRYEYLKELNNNTTTKSNKNKVPLPPTIVNAGFTDVDLIGETFVITPDLVATNSDPFKELKKEQLKKIVTPQNKNEQKEKTTKNIKYSADSNNKNVGETQTIEFVPNLTKTEDKINIGINNILNKIKK
jgi:hypothetical protein